MAINPQKLLPGSTAFTASTKAASSPNARKKDFKSNVTNIKSFSIGIDKYLDRKFTTDKKILLIQRERIKKKKHLKKKKLLRVERSKIIFSTKYYHSSLDLVFAIVLLTSYCLLVLVD